MPYSEHGLTAEQFYALRNFAKRYGLVWPDLLVVLWSNGRDANEADGAYLRQIRNQLGPSWLAKNRADLMKLFLV